MIRLKMACVCGEMKEKSGLFNFWFEELGWRGHFLATGQRVHRKKQYLWFGLV